MKKCKRDAEPSTSSNKTQWYDKKHSAKEVQSKYYNPTTERKVSLDDNKQISEMTDRLRNTKVRDGVSSRVQTTSKRSGRRNTPVPLPAGKTNFRHASITTPRGKAPRPPDVIEGKSILDKSSVTSVKRDPRPMRSRAYSDSTWRDVDMMRGSNREHSLMLKKPGMKSALPPMASGPSYGRRALPGPGERLRPLVMPTAEIGSSKVFTSRQSMGDKDSRSRGPKGKGIVRRSRTLGDLNSKLTPVQGVKPPLKPKMAHKTSKQKLVETDFIPKVPHSSPTSSSVVLTSSDSTNSMSSMQSEESNKSKLEECIVPSISLDSLSKIGEVNSGSGQFPIFVAETVAPLGTKQPLGKIQINDEDPNSLPALPLINFRPATPLPRDTDNTDETVAHLGKLLRKTVCQAAIRQKELEELMGDIEEYNEINSNLQSQVNVVEG